MTNWKPTYAPKSAIIPKFARSSEPVRRMPSRTSGSRVRCSMATKAASRAAAIANGTTVPAASQPCSGASTIVRTRRSMPAVNVTAPGMSNERRVVSPTRSRGRNRGARARMAIAIGTGSRNVQRHPISVSRPPATRPSEKPLAPVAV